MTQNLAWLEDDWNLVCFSNNYFNPLLFLGCSFTTWVSTVRRRSLFGRGRCFLGRIGWDGCPAPFKFRRHAFGSRCNFRRTHVTAKEPGGRPELSHRHWRHWWEKADGRIGRVYWNQGKMPTFFRLHRILLQIWHHHVLSSGSFYGFLSL